jgi:hypothetical protein
MTSIEKGYLKRITIEGVAIVASILLAFAIDAWWEDRRDRIDERSYLASLRQELTESIEVANQSIESRVIAIAAHESLVAQIQGAPRASIGDLYLWVSSVSLPIQYIPPRSAFNDTVASGGVLLIQSDELRLALAEFDQGLRHLQRIDSASWAVWEERLQPLLEGRVPRVERLRQGLRAKWTDDVPFGNSPHAADFDGVLADPRFEDMLAERWLRLQNGLDGIERLGKHAANLVRLIDIELQSK